MTFKDMYIAGLAVAVGLSLGAAQAQEMPEPDRTIESYGAWELRCERLAPPEGGEAVIQACEVLQTVQLQGQAQPLTQLAIGRPVAGGDLVMIAQLPLGLWLPTGVTLDLGVTGGSHALDLRRCLPGGCLAELTLTDDLLSVLRAESDGESTLGFAIQPDDPARVPLVHTGLGAALDALDRRMAITAAEGED